jgi:hypothetical protein
MNNCNKWVLISQLSALVKGSVRVKGFLLFEALIGIVLFSVLVHATLSWVDGLSRSHRSLKSHVYLLAYASSVMECQLVDTRHIASNEKYKVSTIIVPIHNIFCGDDIFKKPCSNAYYALNTFQEKGSDEGFKCIAWKHYTAGDVT